MIKRLIFDVDGTLIVGIDFVNAVRKTLEKLGVFSEENLKLFLSAIKKYEQIYDNYNEQDYKKHMENAMNVVLPNNFLSVFFEELKSAIPKDNQKIVKTIHNLSEQYELVLLTNYFSESQLNRLNQMGIGKYFIESYGEKKIKPNTQAYIDACGKYKPNECIMIGDDIYLDIKRAKEEGLNTIFVNTKNIDIEENIGIVVDSVEEITLELIEKIDN